MSLEKFIKIELNLIIYDYCVIMEDLPSEILILIFNHLTEIELLNALKVCKYWYEILHPYINKIYDINEKLNKDEQLEILCKKNQVITLKKFVDKNAENLNFNKGLINACEIGHIKIVKLMIKHGATDFNKGLYNACKKRNIDIAKLMIKNGGGGEEGDAYAMAGATDFNSRIYYACYKGKFDIAELIIEKDKFDNHYK
jgi:hypothetical protein